MTKTLFRVICQLDAGARDPNEPWLGLQEGVLYDVVADVKAATTARRPEGDASGYLVRNSDTGVVLPQLYRRDRFVKEGAQTDVDFGRSSANATMGGTSYASAPASPEPAGDSKHFDVGTTVICVDAVGARSFSQPETMLEQDEEYRIVADLTDAVTVRKPEGGSSGYVVQRTDDDAMLAGVWNRRRFAKA